MKRIAFFDAKSYDRESFDALNDGRYDIRYFETRLTPESVPLVEGADAVCAFVNDEVDGRVMEGLAARGVKVVAMRCAGYNNVDFKAAYEKGISVVRVPAYSPYAVAEYTMALLMTLNRRLHKAAARTRDFNFSLVGLTGFDLHGKTVGVIGTGRIGAIFCTICKGYGVRILAYDSHPKDGLGVEYVPLDRLLAESDVISLHCPLTPETAHIINAAAVGKMRKGVCLINTSRGALIDSAALLEGLRTGIVGGAGLDVYEEESEWFYEDRSDVVAQNETLALLVSMPNVLVTSHQAFLTHEALSNIATTTLANLDAYFAGKPLENEICYRCLGPGGSGGVDCTKRRNGRCH